MKTARSFFAAAFFLMAVSCLNFGCVEFEEYEDIPKITLKKISLQNVQDRLGNKSKRMKITFEVVDGDGDVGLKAPAYYGNDPDYKGNLFFTCYEKNSGEPKVVDLKTTYFRIPFIDDEGSQDKTFKADIEFDLTFSLDPKDPETYPQPFTKDSVSVKFYILFWFFC